MKNEKAVILIAAMIVNFAFSSPATCEIVYDSISGGLSTGGTSCCVGPIGQTITLHGTSRMVTKIEVWMGSGGPSTFDVEFYNLDGAGGIPGTLIWQSPTQAFPYSGAFDREVVPVDVSRIEVPSHFAWTVTTITRANNLLGSANPPTIGTSQESWFYFPSTGEWRASDWQFGARIIAVPEPSSAILLVFSAAVLCRRRKARRIVR